MRFAFFAREPIFDQTQQLFAYSLSFRDGNKGCVPEHDTEKQASIESKLEALDLTSISREYKSFIEFTDTALEQELDGFEDPSSIIVHITEQQSSQTLIIEQCQKLKAKGFTFAAQRSSIENIEDTLLELVDIITIDAKHVNSKASDIASESNMSVIRDKRIKLLITSVSSASEFHSCKTAGFSYFQGYYFIHREEHNKDALPSSKLNILNLVSACNDQEFDIKKVNSIIERDASLSYALLRFINNPLINKRTEIDSLQHALIYLGEIEVKKFVALMAVISLSTGQNSELLQVSLVRAKFIELMFKETADKRHESIGFMVGLLSLLDVLLSKPMLEVLAQIALPDIVKITLQGEQTEFMPTLMLIRSFESGVWQTVINYSKEKSISQTNLHDKFNQAIQWANQVSSIQSEFFPRTSPGAT